MNEHALMIQGTTSNAGKSTIAAGLCRLLRRRGYKVAPFKPQNMALNSAVTADGGEIGRAQAVQAEACGLEPLSDMNPVLLKPNSNCGAQVIIHGKVASDMTASSYHLFKPELISAVIASYKRLSNRFDCIIVEGAGSPAEINLRQGDIANMGFAEAVDCPVILVADIDRGGVFAHIIGTLAVLSQSESRRIKGFVINKFRGDMALLSPGLDWLEKETGKPVLGVLPYVDGLHLEAEDSLSKENDCPQAADSTRGNLQVVVPVTPRLSNHTDFDALSLHGQVKLTFTRAGQKLPPADLIILGGSKNVCDDLAFIRQQGWAEQILRHLRFGGKLLGICGGFQMLGGALYDPLALESASKSVPGLGLLDMETTLSPAKQLARVQGTLCLGAVPVSGYEIHMGVSTGAALAAPAVVLQDRTDGAISADRQIMGTYLHGLFEHPQALAAFLSWSGLRDQIDFDYRALRARHIDRIADTVEQNLNIDLLLKTMNLPVSKLPTEESYHDGAAACIYNRCSSLLL